MKLISALALFIFILLKSTCSFSQTNSRYIFIEVPGLTTERGFPEFNQLLSGLEQVNHIQYCQKLGVAIINVKTPSEGFEKTISIILRKSNYKFFIKEPVPIEALISPCQLPN